ncbi:hypothetical protein VTJ83DRAFT_3821 [Remersonia thermophila]|uniref:Uncharacterized protein n=1 Tax=Remersonia thermophila TaxID=72144 RepID=A0ABR4DF91_9PEZI
MHSSATLTTFLALANLALAAPNGWSKTTYADDGPTKLDDCGCEPVYEAILRCQTVPRDNTGDKKVRECVCIPNPDGWYPYMNTCRSCLSPGSYEENDFFDNFSRLVTQLFTSCTEFGGAVRSTGDSLCASNAYHETCVSLGVSGRASWASYEVFREKRVDNGTYVLALGEMPPGGWPQPSSSSSSESSSSSSSKVTKTTAAATAATTTETEGAEATSTDTKAPDATATATTTGATTTGPEPSSPPSDSSATRLGSAWHAVGMVGFVVAGVGAVLL